MKVKQAEISQMLHLEKEMEPQRDEFIHCILNACEIISLFSEKYHWENFNQTPTFNRIEFYSSQKKLWNRILNLYDLPETTPLQTSGLAAGLEKKILLAVSPEEFMRLRPEYAVSSDAWERLLAHEMAHRLHVRILGGDEDAMGPTWFFEGFAIYASGHQISTMIFNEPQEALKAVNQKEFTRGIYAIYSSAFNYFLKHKSLNELISRAGKGDFEKWLIES